MSDEQMKAIVLHFNRCIHERDAACIGELITSDHRFVDSAGQAVVGRKANIANWQRFFEAFPDYRNQFEEIRVEENRVAIRGRSECSDPRLSGPARWTAVITAGKVSEWRVYKVSPDDTDRAGFPFTL